MEINMRTWAKVGSILVGYLYLEDLYGMLYSLNFNVLGLFSNLWGVGWFLLETLVALTPFVPLFYFGWKKKSSMKLLD